MKRKEKQKLLATLIELLIYTGYSIESYMGVPLSDFDFDEVKKLIKKYIKEKADINSETYEEQFENYKHLDL